ncbi:hypothetical protein [Thermococcus peptonophilus]|uniref:Uncharacterized protein n=1 Tax=Thermococcus peptonophilus TaxID=53952 RepID=A0A142CWQ0_9EURY|nr:hypothetical protein [Thermococcus peptonophilus]AMQ19202.1 hypothetical protein A0127_08515 [Thermococcus peptonophilus]
MNHYGKLLTLIFVLIVLSSSYVSAYSTAWCESCHQLLVENDGLFVYNGSEFQDLTWKLEAEGLKGEELLDFIGTLRVANAGNLTLVYAYPYDGLYMGVYNGSAPIVLKPVLAWYVDYARDFLFYDGSIFLVASTGSSPHSASDSVFRLDPKTLNVTGEWDLAWAARDIIAPENAGNIPYAWVYLGLDNKNRLWARVDMILPNTTVYYLYHNGDLELKNETPVGFHIPEVKAPFNIAVEDGIRYELPSFLPEYTLTRYFLVTNGTKRDITKEVLKLAYSSRPLKSLYGFWSWEKNEWVVSFRLYNLPVVYRVSGKCREALYIDGLPIAEYKGSYVILGNGTLSWRNYTVETPRKTYYWLDYQEDENEHSSVWVQVYRKNDHPLVAFLWEIRQNGTTTEGFTAYELTDEGFKIFNTTDERDLGKNLIPPRYIPVNGEYILNNETGTLQIDHENNTALIINNSRRIPISYALADKTEAVVVGNNTFLLITWRDAYIVPPYYEPLSVLGLPLCSDLNTGMRENAPRIAVLTVVAVILVGILLWRLRTRGA